MNRGGEPETIEKIKKRAVMRVPDSNKDGETEGLGDREEMK